MLKPDLWGMSFKSIVHEAEKPLNSDHEVFTVKLEFLAPSGTALPRALQEIDAALERALTRKEPKEGVDELLGGSSSSETD